MRNNFDDETQSLNINPNNKIQEINQTQNKEVSTSQEGKIIIRNSSFEVLRIILMYLIILSHIKFHTKAFPNLEEKNYLKIITGKYIALRIISNYGSLSDIIFIMITGYFSIKRLNFNYTKFILIASETYLYHYLFYYLSFILKDKYKNIEMLKQKTGSVYFPLITILGHWYTQHYLLLLIFLPFINTGLLSLSHEQYKNLIILIFIFYCILRSFVNTYKIVSSIFLVNHLLTLILPYIFGAYIRLYDLKYKKFWKIFGIICLYLTVIFEIISEYLSLYYKSYIFISYNKEFSLSINSPLSFICSVGVIAIFKDIKKYNKFINFISSSVLGIYLIHANKNISPFIYNGWFPLNDYNEDYFFVKYFIKAFIIFVICLIIDIIRRFTIGFSIEIILEYLIKFKKCIKENKNYIII